MSESMGSVEGSVAEATMPEGSHDFVAPLAGATVGRVEFIHGASRVAIRGDGAITDLCRAHFEGPLPEVEGRTGVVTLRYPRFAPVDWVRFGLMKDRHAAAVVLTTTLPWTVAFDGGVTKTEADLRALRITAVEIEGGASELVLNLPEPVGIVPIRIGGGVSKCTIHRPAGTAVRLQIKGGVSQLVLDDQRFGAIGGETRLTSGAADAPDRYEINVGGGASKLTVD